MMNVFLVDLTHGGVKISSELAKSEQYENVFAYDLYNTLKDEDESLLDTYNVTILKDLDSFKEELKTNSIKRFDETLRNGNVEKDLIINPIHSSLKINELLIEIKASIERETDFRIENEEIILNQYDMMNQLDSAKHYYRNAAIALNDTNCLVYRDIATHQVYLEYEISNQADTAIKALSYYLSVSNSLEEYLVRASVIGEIFYHERQFDSAWVYLSKVFEYFSKEAVNRYKS